MPALNRTVTLVQMNAVAMLVGKDLDFDMPRAGQIALDQHPGIAKGRLGFALC